jgi:hypothetical protein
MTKQNTEEPTIVAASSMVHEPSLLPDRIIIRDLGDEHVVHAQVFEPGKKPWYRQGNYFKKRAMCEPLRSRRVDHQRPSARRRG